MIALQASGLSFAYPGGKQLFCDVNLMVNEGECVAVVGASGCGKSTLCLLLTGIIPRSIGGNIKGKVILYNDEAPSLALSVIVSRIGIVFQDPDAQLFSSTVEEEVAFGPENLCLGREEIGKRIENSLEAVGMSEYRYFNPNDLSGGQKQLLALAAVLALSPRIIIFDEAFSQLDEESTVLVKNTVRLLKEQGKAILIIEHDRDNLDIADRIYSFENGRLQENV